MRKFFPALYLLGAALAFAQTATNVQKGGAAGGNNITQDLTIGTGRTLTIASGGTLSLASGSSFTPGAGTINWTALTGTPTTVAGYGIVDGVSTGGSYANPSWITSLASSKLTGGIPSTALPALSGDVSSTAGSAVVTLNTVFSSPNTYGSATTVPVVTINGKGLTTAVSTATISIPSTAISDASTTGKSLLTAGNAGTARSVLGLATVAATGAYSDLTGQPTFDTFSPMISLGDTIYGGASGHGTRLAGNTTSTKQFLTQTGTGSVSAAPGWAAIANADIPTTLTGQTYNGLTLTPNAVGFSIAGGTTSKTLTLLNSLTFQGADSSTLNIGSGGTLGSNAFTSVAYAPLASPSLTGTPTAPTASADTNTTQLATTAFTVGQAATATPLVDGTAAVGTSLRYARGDHVHPTDTSRAPLASPTFTGKVTTAASATSGAGFNLPPGSAPTSPGNGDLWSTTTGIFAQINGSTIGPLAAGSGTITSSTIGQIPVYTAATTIGGSTNLTFSSTSDLALQVAASGTHGITLDNSSGSPTIGFNQSSASKTVLGSVRTATNILSDTAVNDYAINNVASGAFRIGLNNGSSQFVLTGGTGALNLTPVARTSGTLPYFNVNTPADTGITASTESFGFRITGTTRTWNAGTTTMQREVLFPGPIYAGTSATATFTDAFTVGITPPSVGTNAAITRAHSLGLLDSTSATSSITGGLIVAATFGTTATSVGIGGGNVNAGGNITSGGSITVLGGIRGAPNNTAAAAGNIGEYMTSTVSSGSAVTLTTGTPANVTSITLTAGDWDVGANLAFTVGSTTTVNYVGGGASSTSGALGPLNGGGGTGASTIVGFTGTTLSLAGFDLSYPCPTSRITVNSGTLTVYLVSQAAFGVSTLKAYGTIWARRSANAQ